jgi:putative ABC transport system permease protein
MNIRRTLHISLNVLFGHKLRTLLSALAVGTGVAAVVMMVGASKAAQNDTAKKIENLGTDLISVQASRIKNLGGRARHGTRFTTTTVNDIRAIKRKVSGVKRAGGTFDRHVNANYKNVKTRTTLMGVEPEVFEIWRLGAVSGRLYTQRDEEKIARVCVLGQTTKSNLFGDIDPVGEVIQVGPLPLKVIGVSSPRGMDYSGDDLDDVIYVPLQTAMKRYFNVTYLEAIIVQTYDKESMDEVKDEITRVLRKNHRIKEGKEDDFTIQTQEQLLKSEMQTEEAFGLLVAVVAGLSMVTGGIGIFAVMLISLRERKREVGLRRAIGARHKDITIQFMLEALILSLIGGIIGIIVGLLGCFIITKLNHWETLIPFSTLLFAFLISVVTGVIFGFYPARLASKMEPAEALRAAV